MAQKVLHQEYKEGVRARDALLVVRAHIEDQLQQLDILIMLKEKEFQMRQEVEKASSSADELCILHVFGCSFQHNIDTTKVIAHWFIVVAHQYHRNCQLHSFFSYVPFE